MAYQDRDALTVVKLKIEIQDNWDNILPEIQDIWDNILPQYIKKLATCLPTLLEKIRLKGKLLGK